MIAALPMYHSNPSRVQAFWLTISKKLRESLGVYVPPEPAWPDDLLKHWQSKGLLISQACGYPLVTELKDKVRVIGTFHYGVPGCDGHMCRSQLVVRDNDPATTLSELRGRRVAYNGTDSQSGYNSLRALVAPLSRKGRFFDDCIETGSHQKSVMAVRDDLADIASIDCVSFAGFVKYAPEVTRGIRILSQSSPYPGLPLITSMNTSDEVLAALRAALKWATNEPSLARIREDIFISDFEPMEFSDYQICSDMRDSAILLGYPHLQ
jgi:ABC-type phosphate/phosphonate transport system substrate-binding protein